MKESLPVHVDLVGWLFIVWGALTAVIGTSMLALGIGALALATSGVTGGQFAAQLTAVLFTVLAAMALIWGGAHIAVGLPLLRHRHWSRLGALMLGSVDLLLLPYGTALGCYTLLTLLREDAKPLFLEGQRDHT